MWANQISITGIVFHLLDRPFFDHFKEIDACFGYLAGDVVLRKICQRFKGTIRTYGHIGRYGGEEFLNLLLAMGQGQR